MLFYCLEKKTIRNIYKRDHLQSTIIVFYEIEFLELCNLFKYFVSLYSHTILYSNLCHI